MNVVDGCLEMPLSEGDKVLMIKNLIKRTEQEITEAETDLKKLIVLKGEIASLKEKLVEIE